MRRTLLSLSRGERVSSPISAARAHELLDGALSALAAGPGSAAEATALARLREKLLGIRRNPAVSAQAHVDDDIEEIDAREVTGINGDCKQAGERQKPGEAGAAEPRCRAAGPKF